MRFSNTWIFAILLKCGLIETLTFTYKIMLYFTLSVKKTPIYTFKRKIALLECTKILTTKKCFFPIYYCGKIRRIYFFAERFINQVSCSLSFLKVCSHLRDGKKEWRNYIKLCPILFQLSSWISFTFLGFCFIPTHIRVNVSTESQFKEASIMYSVLCETQIWLQSLYSVLLFASS